MYIHAFNIMYMMCIQSRVPQELEIIKQAKTEKKARIFFLIVYLK
jgi:hypothetical protein